MYVNPLHRPSCVSAGVNEVTYRAGDVAVVDGDELDKAVVILSGSRKFKQAMGTYVSFN